MNIIKLAQTINLNELQGKMKDGPFNPDVIPDTATGSAAKTATFASIYQNVINLFLYGMGVIAVLVFIYAGIQYMTAGGDQEKAEKAKKTIVGAIIGIVLIAASLVIYNFTIGAVDNSNSAAPSEVNVPIK